MRTDILGDTSRRASELRYVTEHFQDLRGLLLAPLWAGLLVLAAVAISYSPSRWHLAAAALGIALFSFAWARWISRWYERRYGLVRNPEPWEQAVPSGIISILHPEPRPRRGNYNGYRAFYLAMCAVYVLPVLFPRSNHQSGWGMIWVLFLILPRCLYRTPDSGWIRLRRVLSIAALLIVFAMYLSFLFAHIGKWSYVEVSCTALLLLDLYDHWLLTHLLSGGAMEASHEA